MNTEPSSHRLESGQTSVRQLSTPYRGAGQDLYGCHTLLCDGQLCNLKTREDRRVVSDGEIRWRALR
jgi:hypothetical protein